MSARAEGRAKGRVELLCFPSRSPFNRPAQKFFVLTALSPGFDPDGLGRVRMRECVCVHIHAQVRWSR